MFQNVLIACSKLFVLDAVIFKNYGLYDKNRRFPHHLKTDKGPN